MRRKTMWILTAMVVLLGSAVALGAGKADLVLKGGEGARVGQTCSVEIWVEAPGGQQVDGAAVQLRFDPARVEILRVSPGEALPLKLTEKTDRAQGTLKLAYGKLESFPSGRFLLATVELRPKLSGSIPLTLITEGAFGTQVTFGGASILGKVSGLTLAVR